MYFQLVWEKKNGGKRFGEMAQWVKMLAAKSDSLSSIPAIYMRELLSPNNHGCALAHGHT